MANTVLAASLLRVQDANDCFRENPDPGGGGGGLAAGLAHPVARGHAAQRAA